MSLTVEQAIATRRANRSFQNTPIPDEVLDRVIAQALEAPSAFNLQLRDLVVVRDPAVKEAIYQAGFKQAQFREAPAILVAVGRAEMLPEDAASIVGETRIAEIQAIERPVSPQALREAALKDATLMAAFALLAATSEGLASCPTSGWNEEGIKQAIGLGGRADRGIAMVIPIGYSDVQPPHPGRESQRRINDHY